MYKSPITVNMMDELTQRFIEQTEDGIVTKVREVMQIDIDKEELEKALKYDRYQYEHGYANGRMDGHASGYKERDDEIVRCGECGHYHSEDDPAYCDELCTIHIDKTDGCLRGIKRGVKVGYRAADGERKDGKENDE